jgi:hypothetical protein
LPAIEVVGESEERPYNDRDGRRSESESAKVDQGIMSGSRKGKEPGDGRRRRDGSREEGGKVVERRKEMTSGSENEENEEKGKGRREEFVAWMAETAVVKSGKGLGGCGEGERLQRLGG